MEFALRIWAISDLHLEFDPDWALPEPRPEFDVLVVAGDLTVKMERGVRWLADRVRGKHVIYVPGNHEFFSSDIDRTVEKARAAAVGTSIHVLQNDVVTIAGVRFAGCTLWTDWSLLGNADAAMRHAGEQMNDYRRIRKSGYSQRLRPIDTLVRHRASCDFLASTLSDGFKGHTVAVCHHAPACDPALGVPTDLLDPAYASDLRYLIEFGAPRLIIHGHFHTSVDWTLAETRIVANPKGYPDELNPRFDPLLTLEI